MIFIQHRINAVSELRNTGAYQGVEIDLRSNGSDLIVAHDPFTEGDHFSDWIQKYRAEKFPGPLIVNTKEDGLETCALEDLKKAGVQHYFFLDTTIPTLVKRTTQGESTFAVRVSAYESTQNALKFAGKADWVWLDCFGGRAPELSWVRELQGHFKICLVSPELHGVHTDMRAFSPLLPFVDAICTRNMEQWKI